MMKASRRLFLRLGSIFGLTLPTLAQQPFPAMKDDKDKKRQEALDALRERAKKMRDEIAEFQKERQKKKAEHQQMIEDAKKKMGEKK